MTRPDRPPHHAARARPRGSGAARSRTRSARSRPPSRRPTPTATPVDVSSDNNTGRNVLFLIGGALIVGFGVMGWFIMRDARSAIPQAELAGPRLRDEGPHTPPEAGEGARRAPRPARRSARARPTGNGDGPRPLAAGADHERADRQHGTLPPQLRERPREALEPARPAVVGEARDVGAAQEDQQIAAVDGVDPGPLALEPARDRVARGARGARAAPVPVEGATARRSTTPSACWATATARVKCSASRLSAWRLSSSRAQVDGERQRRDQKRERCRHDPEHASDPQPSIFHISCRRTAPCPRTCRSPSSRSACSSAGASATCSASRCAAARARRRGSSTRGRRPRTGRPGSHHVLARVFKDIFPRYRTMRGYYVLAQGRLGLPRAAGRDRRRGAARDRVQGRTSRTTGSPSSTGRCRE